MSGLTFVRTPDGSFEIASAEQEHPSQVYCDESGLWIMPLIAFPALSPMELER